MQKVQTMNVSGMLESARDAMTVKRVYGEPIERGGLTLIPAADVQGGGGAGGDAADNGGGGFGVMARPVGVYVIRDGDLRWEPAFDLNRVAVMGMLTGMVALLVLRSAIKAIFRRR